MHLRRDNNPAIRQRKTERHEQLYGGNIGRMGSRSKLLLRAFLGLFDLLDELFRVLVEILLALLAT